MSTSSSIEEASEPAPAPVVNQNHMNGMSQCSRYRDLPNRSSNEALKMHSHFAVKLSETG